MFENKIEEAFLIKIVTFFSFEKAKKSISKGKSEIWKGRLNQNNRLLNFFILIFVGNFGQTWVKSNMSKNLWP